MAAKKTATKAKAAKKPVQRKKPTIADEPPVFVEETDRKLRSGNSGKNSACPACGCFPTITKIRRPGYELRRCRCCGHRFEIIKGGN